MTTTEGPSGPPVTEGRGNLSRAVLAVHVVCIIVGMVVAVAGLFVL